MRVRVLVFGNPRELHLVPRPRSCSDGAEWLVPGSTAAAADAHPVVLRLLQRGRCVFQTVQVVPLPRKDGGVRCGWPCG